MALQLRPVHPRWEGQGRPAVAGIKALGLVSQVKFKPNRIEILDRSDGTRLSMTLASATRTRRP